MDGHLAVMIFVGLYLVLGVIVLTVYIKPIEKKLEKMFNIKIKRPEIKDIKLTKVAIY